MVTLIDLVFKLLDAVLDKAESLSLEEAAAARARIVKGIADRAGRIQSAEDADWAAAPSAHDESGSSGGSDSDSSL